jgi:hypothetical protein
MHDSRPGFLIIVAVALVFLLPTALLAQSPFPITVLVVEGDSVTGVGQVSRIDNVAVNADGDWLIEVDTDNPDADTDTVLLRNAVLYLREGDPLASPAGADINTFDSVNLNLNLDSGWNFFLGGLPGDADSGIFFNTRLVIQEGGRSVAPEFAPETVYLGFFDAKINDLNQLSVVASVDDPDIAGTLERAIVRVTLDGGGVLVSESAVAKEGDVLPGQTEAVADLGTGPHQSSINNLGQVFYFVDLAGATATDGALYLDLDLVAQEGDRSPVAGRTFELLSSRGMDLNNLGEVTFKANLAGDTTSDEMIVVQDRELIREGQSLPAIGAFTFTGFGTGSGPVQIDDHRNVLWFGDWSDPNTDLDTGLFLNDILLVQEGVTMIDGSIVDTIASIQDAFAISDDGRFAVFEADLAGGVNGAFMIEIEAPHPVPDGGKVPGTPMSAGKHANGTDIDVTWDVATCASDDYNLFFGDLANVSTYRYSGAVCNLGAGGQATFTPPAGSAFWVVAGVDAEAREGSHGFESGGRVRDAAADGLCSVATQLRSSICP